MKVVLQRVKKASVSVKGELISEIGAGVLLLTGIGPADSEEVLQKAARKICNLRIFEDSEGKMNLSLKQINGQILAVSQFTLYADCRKGNRPSFAAAAEPRFAEKMFELFIRFLRNEGMTVKKGVFGVRMEVGLVNHGPVTIVLEFN